MKKLAVILLVCLCQSLVAGDTIFLTPEDGHPSDSRLGKLTKAAAFVRIQNFVLKQITTDLPEISQDAEEAGRIFNASDLGKGASQIEGQFISERDKELLQNSNREADALFGKMKDTMDLTPETATNFIEQVKKRSKGALTPDVRATLLSINPEFVQNPAAELKAGWRQIFSLAQNEKGNNIPLTLELPMSWRGQDDPKESVAKTFRSGCGHGAVICTIVTLPVPEDDEDKTNEELADQMRQTLNKKFARIQGGEMKMLENRRIEIDKLPAVTFTLNGNQSLTGVDERSIVTNYMLFYDGWLISIGFTIAPQELQNETLEEAHQHFLPAYKSIAGSIRVD